ncbi:mu-type opioid receptor-like [Haliotis cracherodii]|uniref:mu-type opioid receptor-like n=1 Tax=Haliotis cracherodii TaxID=6455 RepID=UPI0039EADBBB
MSFVVLCVQGSKERVNVILFGMAVSDTLFLVTALMRKLNCLVSKVDAFAADDLSTIMKSHVLVLNILFGRITTLLIMLIAIERFIAVYLPLKAHYLLTPRRMIVAVTILYISATIAMAPALNLYETVWVYNSQQNRTMPFLKPTKFNLDNLDFFSFYLDQFLNFVFRYIPLFLVCLFTALVVSKLKRSASWRRRISSTVDKVKDDDRTTSMLLLVNAIYLICVIPGTITITVRFIIPEFDFRGRYANTFNLIGGFILLIESCNSSVNFIVYMAMSRRFSATYKRVFLCRRMPVFKYGESQVTHLPSSSGSAP